MGPLGNITYVISGVLALIAAGAGMIGFFRANVAKSTIELYRDDNVALRARLTTVEQQSREQETTIKALQASRDYLTSVLTQADALKALRDIVDRIAIKVGA